MATNPFRETEEPIEPGRLAAWLLRNANPRTDPNRNGHPLLLAAAPKASARGAASPRPAPLGCEFGHRLGRGAVLALFALTGLLAVLFLVVSLTEEPETPPAIEAATLPQPEPARQEAAAPPEKLAAAQPAPSDVAAVGRTSAGPPLSAEAPPPAPAKTAPVPEESVARSGLALTPAEIRDLSARGEALLNAGEATTARSLLERAALAGDGTAALRLGQSYDPAYSAGGRLRDGATSV